MLTSSTSTHSETTHSAGEEAHSADSVPGTSRPRAVLLAAEVATRRGDTVVLTPGRWGVGSADGNQIVIDHETVASRHAMIVVTEHRVLVTSWASGTYVNGERCRESLLCPGDVLTIGTVDLRLRAADPSELISHLPDVNSPANRSPVMHPVTAEETLRRLDDLDTALGLLDEELTGSNESTDQLDELIDQIETDIARRADDPSRQVEADSLSEEQLCAPSSDDVSSAGLAEPWAAEGVAEDVSRPLNAARPLSLDELMSEVVSSEGEADFATVETPFSNAAETDFADDEHPSEAEEFSQLVGSTSVLAQNLTLNALRSRAEAVRQLDEMILAASQNDSSIDRVTGSGSSTTAPPDRLRSAASDDWLETADSDSMASESQAGLSSHNEAGGAADDDGFFADEPASEDLAANDDWLAENPPQSESQPEAEGSDTVEFSAMDTVNEAGSLLASLFGEEASDRQTASVEAAEEPGWISGPEATVSESVERFGMSTDIDDALPNADFDPTSEADTEFDLTSMSEQTSDSNDGAEAIIEPESDAVGETDEDATVVRSRLAEMFGLPGLKSASPLETEAEDHRDATDNESPFDSPDDDLPWDSAKQDHGTNRAASVAASTNLTSWLDGMRGGRATPVEQNADHVDDAGDSPADQADSQAQSDKQSAASDLDRTKGSSEGDGDDSVAAYMQALLARNRVRQGLPEQPDAYVVMPNAASSEPTDESEEAEQDAVEIEAREQFSELDSREVSDCDQSPSWLSQEPKHQLDKDRMRADTQALREVANASARSAVTRASRRQLKVQVVVKTTASVAMLGCGVAASLLGVSTMFAALAMGVGAYFAFDLGLTIVRNWKRITS